MPIVTRFVTGPFQFLEYLAACMVLVLTLGAVSACGASTPNATPQQRGYGLLKDYRAVLVLANAYRDLPTCRTGQNILKDACKDQTILNHIRKADDDAFAVITAAVDTVRKSCPDETCNVAQVAINGGLNAINVFREIVQNRDLFKEVPKPAGV